MASAVIKPRNALRQRSKFRVHHPREEMDNVHHQSHDFSTSRVHDIHHIRRCGARDDIKLSISIDFSDIRSYWGN